MAGDQAKRLLRPVAECAIFVPTRERFLRAGHDSGVQRLLASAPRHLLEERVPGRHSGSRAGTDRDTHNQEWFVRLTGIPRLA